MTNYCQQRLSCRWFSCRAGHIADSLPSWLKVRVTKCVAMRLSEWSREERQEYLGQQQRKENAVGGCLKGSLCICQFKAPQDSMYFNQNLQLFRSCSCSCSCDTTITSRHKEPRLDCGRLGDGGWGRKEMRDRRGGKRTRLVVATMVCDPKLY
jgi:hypothetical protein